MERAGGSVGSHEWDDGVAVVHVAGDVDVETCDRLWTAIEQAFGNGAASVVLDLSRTAFMDSSALRVIVRAAGRWGADAVTIRNPNRQVAKVFEITGLRRSLIVDLVGSEVDAAQA